MKTAFVTGGSGGIGSAVCRRLSEEGYAVAVGYCKGKEQAEAICKELMSGGSVAKAIHIDLTDPLSISEAFKEAESIFGSVTVLVNNAGRAHIGLFTDMSEEEIVSLLTADLTGAMLLTRLAVLGMVKRGSGRIVNISSVWGEVGASCETVYSAAKAGIIGFTKALGKELAPSGVTVNCISAGAIDTPMNACLSENEKDDLIDSIPAGRLGSPEEIAELAAFLCSDKAGYITAQSIRCDGGWC